MRNHARKNGRSVEQRVWLFLQRQADPCSARTIELALKLTRSGAVTALARLRAKGCVVSTGATNARRHVATDIRPDDMRGLAVGSMRALKENSVVNNQPSAKASRPRIKYGIELERAWRAR